MAFAGHPFITDDAGTQGKGNWQLELLAQRDHHVHAAGDGPVQLRGRSTLFNPVLTYGLRDNLDVALGLNHLRHRDSENGVAATDSASGAADSTLELKWRFYDENGFSLALKPGLSLPTGDENRGLGTGRTSWGLNFIAAYEVKPWSFMGNVAFSRPRFKLAQDAADNRGPHMGGKLSEGKLEKTIVTCPLHHSQFDLRDGHVVRWTDWSGVKLSLAKVVRSPRPIKTYRVKIEGGRVVVETDRIPIVVA